MPAFSFHFWRQKNRQWIQHFKKNLPISLFFLIVFYLLLIGFGPQYLMFVSIFTVMFKLNYKKSRSLWDLLKFCSFQFLLSALAYLATLNILLTISLNLLVPFYLIYTKSSQFNPKGYFISLMTFTFCQLIQVKTSFLQQSQAYLTGLLLFLLVMGAYQLFTKRFSKEQLEKNGFTLLSDLLLAAGQGQKDAASLAKLATLTQQLYHQAYFTSGSKKQIAPKARIIYNFAFLFQRALYFFTSIDDLAEQNTTIEQLMTEAAAYFDQASRFAFLSANEKVVLEQQGQALLVAVEHSDALAAAFLKNLLSHSLFILRLLAKDPAVVDAHWQTPKHRQTWQRFLRNFKLDSFELRVALRFSLVMAFSFFIMSLTHVTRGTWLPMNAFLLLQPMNEETSYRMKTRFIGTIIGCVISIFAIPFFAGDLSHLILASLLGIYVFTIIPGTAFQATLSTVFALFLTSLALPDLTAAGLRFFFVFLACGLVYVVNRFVFPTSMQKQFAFNFQELFHVHQASLVVLRHALMDRINYGTIADLQLQYHLLHSEIRTYLTKHPELDQAFYKEFLAVSWQMTTIVEQLLLLANSKPIAESDAALIDQTIDSFDYVLTLIQHLLNFKTPPLAMPHTEFKRELALDPEISYLLVQYSKKLSIMYHNTFLYVDQQKTAQHSY